MLNTELLSFEYKGIPIGIPVLSNLDYTNNTLVIGHNFFHTGEKNRIGLRTFSYCLKNKRYVDLPKFTFCIFIISGSRSPFNISATHSFKFKIFKKPFIGLSQYQNDSLHPLYV